jgi:hypothetical protein
MKNQMTLLPKQLICAYHDQFKPVRLAGTPCVTVVFELGVLGQRHRGLRYSGPEPELA